MKVTVEEWLSFSISCAPECLSKVLEKSHGKNDCILIYSRGRCHHGFLEFAVYTKDYLKIDQFYCNCTYSPVSAWWFWDPHIW